MSPAYPGGQRGVVMAETAVHQLPGRDFTHLPPRVRLEETVATHDVEPVPDPTSGKDTETEFVLRHAMP